MCCLFPSVIKKTTQSYEQIVELIRFNHVPDSRGIFIIPKIEVKGFDHKAAYVVQHCVTTA